MISAEYLFVLIVYSGLLLVIRLHFIIIFMHIKFTPFYQIATRKIQGCQHKFYSMKVQIDKQMALIQFLQLQVHMKLVFFLLFYLQIRFQMHRKTYSMHSDYDSVIPSKNKKYDSIRLSNSINPLFENSTQLSYRSPNQPAKPLSTINPIKSHSRNYSDFMSATQRKCDPQIYQPSPAFEQNKGKNLQQKLAAIQARLAKTQNMLSSIVMSDNKLSSQIIPKKSTHQKQVQLVNQDTATYLFDLRNRVNSLNSDSTQNFAKSFKLKQNLNSQLVSQISNIIDEKISINCQSIYQKMKSYFKDQLKLINERIYKLSITENCQKSLLKSNRKYFGVPISFIYQQVIKKNDQQVYKYNSFEKEKVQIFHQNNGTSLNKILYYIDPEGFLLDQNNHYLINSQMKQVKLSEKQIKILIKQKILRS